MQKREITKKKGHKCTTPECQRGEHCKYQHNMAVDVVMERDERKENQVKRCRFGKRCKELSDNKCLFIHECGFGDKCSKKENCYYTHSDPESSRNDVEQVTNKDEEVRMCKDGKMCKNIENGECNNIHECGYGPRCIKKNNCRFVHRKQGENSVENDHKPMCRHGGKCRHIESCLFNHECAFGRNCTKKKTCRFTHEEENTEEAYIQTMNETETGGGKTNDHTRPKKDKSSIMCKFYKNCKHGENCEFKHPEKKDKKNKSKTVMEGMLKQLHSLTEEIKTIKVTMASMQIETGKK